MRILKKCILIFAIAITSISLLSCTNKLPTETEKQTETDVFDMINLHDFDEYTGKKNIDLFLEKTPTYPINCHISDFTLKEDSADFIVTEKNIYNEDDYKKIYAHYKLKNIKGENAYDATVSILFYNSRAESHESMRLVLSECADPTIYSSSLKIGDFAIGGIYDIDFIRGNVQVNVKGSYYNGITIEDLAKEIDQQILEILNGED